MKIERAKAAASEPDVCRVRVWFGPHLIAEYGAPVGEARAYAGHMPYLFHGLRVSLGETDAERTLPPLPERRLWPLTVG